MANFTLQLLSYYGEAGTLAATTAPILGALVDKFDDQYANTIKIGEGDTYIPGPWLVGGADPSLNTVAGIGTTALGRPDIAIFNALGTTVSALGNHEFDLGSPVLQAAVAASGSGASKWVGALFPYITDNINVAADSAIKGLTDKSLGGTSTNSFAGLETTAINGKIAPYAIKTINGEKIGFVGATTYELSNKSSPNGTVTTGVKSIDDSIKIPELAPVIQASVDALKALGVNKIIMVDQLDTLTRDTALAPLLSGVDIIVAGGGHERLADANDSLVGFNGHDATAYAGGSYPLQFTGADGKAGLIVTTDTEFTYLSRLVVDFDENGDIVLSSLNDTINGAYASTEATLQAAYGTTQTAAQIIAGSTIGSQVNAISSAINTVIVSKDSNIFGYTNVYLEGDRVYGRAQEVNLGDVTADANLYKAKLALPSGSYIVSLKNGGGIRASVGSVDENGVKLPPSATSVKPAGGISQLDIENALRFDNQMMVFDTTATGLKNIFEYATGLAAGNGGFAQTGGMRISYDPAKAFGSRVQNISLIDQNGDVIARVVENGVVSASAPSTIQMVCLNFTANGGDGYNIKANATNFRYLLKDGTLSNAISDTSLDFTAAPAFTNAGVTSSQILGEQKAFEDYLQAFHGTPAKAYSVADTPAAQDIRYENITLRSDIVFQGKNINGTSGADTLSGGAGNDSIDGGDGVDTLTVAGLMADATVTKNTSGGGWTVTTAAGGKDVVTNVEVLSFSDGKLDISGFTAVVPTVTQLSAGDVYQDRAVLLAKGNHLGTMTFQVSTKADFSSLVTTKMVNVTDAMVPAKVVLDAGTLSAGTKYYWRATDADGVTSSASFTTADAATVKNGFVMGVTGDWRGELAPYPAIKNAATAGLDLFVKLGDTIYADYPTTAVPADQATTLAEYLAKHNEVYTPKAGLDAWGDLQKTTAILSVIDDHEVTNDFAGGAPASSDARFNSTTGLINDTQLYENGLTAFVDYNAIEDKTWADTGSNPVSDGEHKLYRYVQEGKDAAVYVVDARSFRDAELAPVSDLTNPAAVGSFLVQSATPGRTLLGNVQLAQLKSDLLDAQSKGTVWKFIQLPEPIQNLGVLGAQDRYEGYAAERTDLLKFIHDNHLTGVVFISADIHGTVVNNLTYQETVGGPQIAVAAWEITTGSVGFDAPFGQTVDQLAVAAGLISGPQQAFYNSLPVAPDADSTLNDKDDFIKSLVNQQVTALGYDKVGLNDNLAQANGLINATLTTGDYLVTHDYGWTKFSVDAVTSQLTVTTYGVPYYSAADAAANPAAIAALTPTVVSQFTVDATLADAIVNGTTGADSLAGTAGNDSILGMAGDDTITAGAGNDTIYGGPGNDMIDGGTGSDVVVYDVARSAATITRTGPGAWTVTTATGGTDTLTGIEQVKFTDSSLYTTDQTAYIVPKQSNVHFTSILSAGDVAGVKADGTPWLMAGIPDGLGAFDNGDGTITVLMNQEIGNTLGIVRADGAKGAFVSKLIIDKATLSVISGSDADNQQYLWNSTTHQYDLSTTALSRFCSADLAPVSAYYDATSGFGTQARIFLNGEESGQEGRPMAHIITGADAGKAYELPGFGNASWENLLANPYTGVKTVVMANEDATPGQIYMYIGTKQATGSTLDQAGLTNGTLYGIKADFRTETNTTSPLSGSFTITALPDETNRTGANLQADSNAAGITEWLRPEDGAWDTINHNRYYFVTTNAIDKPSRLWALDFVDATDPSKGGTYKALLDGTEGQVMFDNITVSADGTVTLLEDPGNYQGAAKVWQYDPNTDTLTEIGRHDTARFGDLGTPNIAPTAPFTIDEESSGVIDVSSLLGTATTKAFLIDTQAHYTFTGPNAAEVVEGGQLQLMTIDTVINGTSGNDNLAGTFIGETINGGAGSDTITGGGGNDTINGGAGRDTAIFAVAKASATVVHNADGSYTVTSAQGTDTLQSIEKLQFTDGATLLSAAVHGDLNGDGQADLVMVNDTTGTYRLVSTNVGTVTNTTDLTGLNGWDLKSIRDMDGDGKVDILAQNDGLGGIIWELNMDGGQITGGGPVAYYPTGWTVKAYADITGDGKTDILWQNDSTGLMWTWQMDGTQIVGGGVLGFAPAGWTLKGTADFNGDSRAELLWQNDSNGLMWEWTTDGVALNGGGAVSDPVNGYGQFAPTGSTIKGFGDLNGDGRADVVWQNDTTGQVQVWLMNGTTLQTSANVGSAVATTKVVEITDFNGDDMADILVMDAAGNLTAWLMNGTTVGSTVSMGTVASGFHVFA